MKDDYNILKLRVLLYFLNNQKEQCSVVKIARVLDVTKQRVSRVIMDLEEQGCADRTDVRHPVLTEKGRLMGEKYAERIKVSLNHLLFEGVSLENAEEDAYHWAINNTDETMDVIRSSEAKYRMKYALRMEKSFNGKKLCDVLEDGMYSLNFVIYRQHIKNGNNLSMANAGFEHPCTLVVKNGVGKIRLRAININTKSPVNGKEVTGKVESLTYQYNGDFVSADRTNDIITIPLEAVHFVNIGEKINQVIHGSVCIKIKCNIDSSIMPESVALLNMII